MLDLYSRGIKGVLMAKKKRKKSFRLFIKTFLCLIYLLISFVLVVSAYRLHLKDKEIIKWSEVKTTNQYSYLEIIQCLNLLRL